MADVPLPPPLTIGMPRRLGRIVAPVLAVLVSGLILLFGLSPRVPSPLRILSDKVTHGVGYALLAFTSAEALAVLRWGPSPPFGALAYAAAHGAALEAMQSYTPRRHAQWGDLLADAVGALVGVASWWLWRRR